jgi:XRE family transcriptional regulator, aerobic/anaerobic benzoate catabolism transcriptional regulator
MKEADNNLDPVPGITTTEAPMAEGAGAETLFLAELGQRVRNIRAVRGMSRKVLSKISGVSERYIAQLESGQGNASIILLRRVATAMGAKLEDLIPDSEGSSHWPVLRDLLKTATLEQVARAKEILSGSALTTSSARQRVALIGLRGAGKSTLGRIAADSVGWKFIELDKEIERESGLSVPEIFALYGQERYRRLEQNALRRLIGQPGPMVVATAGGVVAEPLTFDLLLSAFFTIWLKATAEEHMRRVRAQGDLRPMGNDPSAMQELRAILLGREPLYARARTAIDTSGLTIQEAADRLVHVIETNIRVSE